MGVVVVVVVVMMMMMMMMMMMSTQVMKPGGLVLFRDYGLYDHAMLRFKVCGLWFAAVCGHSRQKGQKIEENFYMRHDGTRAFYFAKGSG
jgi:methyltransferase-like protein 6